MIFVRIFERIPVEKGLFTHVWLMSNFLSYFALGPQHSIILIVFVLAYKNKTQPVTSVFIQMNRLLSIMVVEIGGFVGTLFENVAQAMSYMADPFRLKALARTSGILRLNSSEYSKIVRVNVW